MGREGQIFQMHLHYTRTVRLRTTKFSRITHVGRGVFPGGQPHSRHKERGPNAAQFQGFLLFMHTYCHKKTKFDVITQMGRGLVFRGQPRLCPKERAPVLPQFWVFSTHLCPYPLSQNDHVRQGNTWGRGIPVLGTLYLCLQPLT